MYIASTENNRLVRANLDGSDAENLGNLGGLLDKPSGIALNIKPGKMYVTSSGNKSVVRAELDGSLAFDLSNLNQFLDAPHGIALASG
jgi:hypothetical protein